MSFQIVLHVHRTKETFPVWKTEVILIQIGEGEKPATLTGQMRMLGASAEICRILARYVVIISICLNPVFSCIIVIFSKWWSKPSSKNSFEYQQPFYCPINICSLCPISEAWVVFAFMCIASFSLCFISIFLLVTRAQLQHKDCYFLFLFFFFPTVNTLTHPPTHTHSHPSPFTICATTMDQSLVVSVEREVPCQPVDWHIKTFFFFFFESCT